MFFLPKQALIHMMVYIFRWGEAGNCLELSIKIGNIVKTAFEANRGNTFVVPDQ